MKKILILSANPKNTSQLRLDEEVREIQAALRLSKHREEFEIVTEWAVRVNDLRRTLLDHKPHIVHFSGHGSGSDGLALENKLGQMQLVSSESLAGLFKLFEDLVECVVLNACYSEVQAEAIYQHIDCVIGMNRSIGDMAAIEFATGFYDALAAGRNYRDSFDFGCGGINLHGISESKTPQIKIRQRHSQVETLTHLVKSNKDNVMGHDNKGGQNRSVSIGGSVTGSAITTGDSNTATVNFQSVNLPAPESIDIRGEVNALREILANLESSHRRKIDNAFDDAQEELDKSQPDKDEVGKALNRVLDYAKKTSGFVSVLDKVEPHVKNATAWLGDKWHILLNFIN